MTYVIVDCYIEPVTKSNILGYYEILKVFRARCGLYWLVIGLECSRGLERASDNINFPNPTRTYVYTDRERDRSTFSIWVLIGEGFVMVFLVSGEFRVWSFWVLGCWAMVFLVSGLTLSSLACRLG